MKKTILLISLTILTLTTAKSQEKIQFGVKAGFNFTNIISDFLIEKEYKTGFHIGVLAEIPFGAKFSLQPEILYSTQGVKGNEILLTVHFPGGPAYPPFSAEYKLDYIQVPILAKFYLFKNFSLDIGPSFNFLVNIEETRGSVSISDFGNNFEFGGILGISYKLKSDLFGSIRYTKGFTDVFDRDYFTENVKNYGFLIGIGYLF